MVFGVGDELSVRVSAATGGFERAIDSAERSLSGLRSTAATTTGTLRTAASRADNLADQLGEVSRSAGGATLALSTFGGSAAASSLSLRELSLAITGAAIPAVAGLSTALLPLAGVLGGVAAGATALAGAFGAVVGSGLIAFGQERGEQNQQRLEEVEAQIEELEELRETEGELTEQQEDRLETLEEEQETLEDQTGVVGGLESAFSDLRDELTPIIVEFGEEFVPLIEDTIDAIPDFARAILDATGDLQPFVDALREAGGFLQETVPDAISRLADLARESLPVLGDLAESGVGVLVDVFDESLRLTREFGDELLALADATGDALGALTSVGETVLETVLPPLTTLVDTVDDAVERAGDVESFGEALNRAFEGVQEALPSLGVELSSILRDGLIRIERFAPQLRRTFFTAFTTALDVLERLRPQILSTVGTLLTQAGLFIRDAAPRLIRFASDTFTSVVDAITETVAGIDFTTVVSDVESGLRTLIDALQVDEIVGSLEDLFDELVTAADDTLTSEQNQQRISTAIGTLTDIGSGVVGDIGETILTKIENFFGEDSDAGSRFSTAVENLTDNLPDFEQIGTDIIDDIESYVTSEDGKKTIRGIGATIGNLVSTAFIETTRILAELASFVIEEQDTLATIGTTIGSALFKGLIDGFSQAIQQRGGLLAAALLDLVAKAVEQTTQTAIQQVVPNISREGAQALAAQNPIVSGLRSREQQLREQAGSPVGTDAVQEIAARGQGTSGGPRTAGPGGELANQQVTLNVEGDGQLAEIVRENAQLELEEVQGRSERIQSRGRRR